MENNNYQGDLADIIRATGGGTIHEAASEVTSVKDSWQFMNNQIDEFGDPFSNVRDPLLHDLHMPTSSSSSFFNTTDDIIVISSKVDNTNGGFDGSSSSGGGGKEISPEQEIIIRRPTNDNNMFSRMVQISPHAKLTPSPSPAAPSPKGSLLAAGNELMISNSKASSSLVENTSIGGGGTGGGGVQISSPRNTGLKRRKSQAKKVVCIPAPAPANSRPSSGEVVPSDLWAWRKYGQKPIKGSPYPRGYYRCSSSKGCSARKQVERSRNDPNMLVITYTSEHNHPWPTQRNALAGSTRSSSHPSKSIAMAASSSSKTTAAHQKTTNYLKEESEEQNDIQRLLLLNDNNQSAAVKKEEVIEDHKQQMDVLEDIHEFTTEEGFQHSYKPSSLPYDESHTNNSSRSEDFFADLGELEADPLNLLFSQGYSGVVEDDHAGRENKAAASSLDPLFGFYDWTGNNNKKSNNYSIQEGSNHQQQQQQPF